MAMIINDAVANVVAPNVEMQLKDFKATPVPYIVGPPGIGKTQILKDYFTKRGWKVVSRCFPAIAFEELTGVPKGKEKDGMFLTEWSVPELLSEVYEAARDGSKVLLFLDDNHLANEEYQKYLFSLLDEKRLKQYRLPDNCAIVVAGNTSTAAGAHRILTPIWQRIMYLEVKPDLKRWIAYITQKEHHVVIPAFLSYMPQYFSEEEKDEKYACPRTWEYLNSMLLSLKFDPEKNVKEFTEVAVSCVGKSAGSEFALYAESLSKIDAKGILEGKIPLADNSKDLWLQAVALAYYLLKTKRDRNILIKFTETFIKLFRKSTDIGVFTSRFIFMMNNTLHEKIIDLIQKIDPEMIEEYFREIGKLYGSIEEGQ